MSSRLALLALLLSPFASARDDEEEKLELAPAARFEFADAIAGARISATVGGARDIRYFRDQVRDGEVPHPNVFTPEGRFSEHDLPIPPAGRCVELLCPAGTAMATTLTVQPEVRWLAQLGFHTGINVADFRRAPLNLVAVIDKSGSMAGEPLDLVKRSLHRVVDQLDNDDQLSIVLYGDTVHTLLAPTSAAQRAALHRQVDQIQSSGSTYMPRRGRRRASA